MEVTRVPPGRPSRTTTGTRTRGWAPLLYKHNERTMIEIPGVLHAFRRFLVIQK